MEANKTVTDVRSVSYDQLTDEGKQASLLGMKEVNLNSVVLVGARFIRLASKLCWKAPYRPLVQCWYNIMHLQSILYGRCDNILFIPKFSSVSGMPFFSNAVPRFDWHFFLHLGEALKRIKAICKENYVRETQRKTDGGPIRDEVCASEPRIWSMYTVVIL